MKEHISKGSAGLFLQIKANSTVTTVEAKKALLDLIQGSLVSRERERNRERGRGTRMGRERRQDDVHGYKSTHGYKYHPWL